jgi:protein gp37
LGSIQFNPDLLRQFDLCVLGGESGNNARPCHIKDLLSAIAQCRLVGVRVFVKQMGSNPIGTSNAIYDLKGGNIERFPAALQIRESPDYAIINQRIQSQADRDRVPARS